jgi:hypothetical protein
MSFDTDYPNRKDHRRPYRGTKAVDRTCRPHGGCPWCREGRLHRDRRRGPAGERETEAEPR